MNQPNDSKSEAVLNTTGDSVSKEKHSFIGRRYPFFGACSSRNAAGLNLESVRANSLYLTQDKNRKTSGATEFIISKLYAIHRSRRETDEDLF